MNIKIIFLMVAIALSQLNGCVRVPGKQKPKPTEARKVILVDISHTAVVLQTRT